MASLWSETIRPGGPGEMCENKIHIPVFSTGSVLPQCIDQHIKTVQLFSVWKVLKFHIFPIFVPFLADPGLRSENIRNYQE